MPSNANETGSGTGAAAACISMVLSTLWPPEVKVRANVAESLLIDPTVMAGEVVVPVPVKVSLNTGVPPGAFADNVNGPGSVPIRSSLVRVAVNGPPAKLKPCELIVTSRVTGKENVGPGVVVTVSTVVVRSGAGRSGGPAAVIAIEEKTPPAGLLQLTLSDPDPPSVPPQAPRSRLPPVARSGRGRYYRGMRRGGHGKPR